MNNNHYSLVDFHSHILPGIDDGSKDLEESLLLLELLKEQGVSTVVATPHFYADDQSLDSFLYNRQLAYDLLLSHCSESAPRIRLGAEVRYYNGISHLAGLEQLCIEGTRVLLLEMPMSRWSTSMIREVLDIANNKNLILVIAHVERYMHLQNVGVYDLLRQNGVLMQVNASWFIHFSSRRKALRMLANGQVHLLGSDCHGVHTRPPQIGEAVRMIRTKFGDAFVEQLNGCCTELLSASPFVN